ncbi:MAG: DUF2249 domain-containing protein [Chitinophagaceae bacterium]|nr:DUF2249 domain-containing protein [Chitinophagaceae bacterium]
MEKRININNDTKISELIKADKASIDAIAGVAKPFQRLKNPILRKIMASRVTIAEAAKMGGCKVEDIVATLTPLGFYYEPISANERVVQSKPQWLLQADKAAIIVYDVRPIIESGTDPLKEILNKFKDVQPGKILCIINSFIPTPLIRLLEQEKAEGSYVETVSAGVFHTYFLRKKKEAAAKKAAVNNIIVDDAASFEAVYNRSSEERIREIDVRHLEMPQPMQVILQELNSLPENHLLYVHHKRVPVYLLEELADKNHEIHILTVDDKNVKMIIFEKP